MKTSTFSALLTAIVLSSTVPAIAADSPAPIKPLRELVYSCTIEEHYVTTEKVAAIRADGDGESTTRRTIDDDGVLTLDVIAATPDGGLVIDASYKGQVTTQAPIRVAILSDGEIRYKMDLPLSAPAVRLLPLFARGIVAGRAISVGESWSPADMPNAPRYTITAVHDSDATIKVEQTIPPSSGAKEYLEATAVYDTDKLRPNSFNATSTLDRPTGANTNMTQRELLSAKLQSDTFDKK